MKQYYKVFSPLLQGALIFSKRHFTADHAVNQFRRGGFTPPQELFDRR
jgi:hypothetical protein